MITKSHVLVTAFVKESKLAFVYFFGEKELCRKYRILLKENEFVG